jgi:hypothetical protein
MRLVFHWIKLHVSRICYWFRYNKKEWWFFNHHVRLSLRTYPGIGIAIRPGGVNIQLILPMIFIGRETTWGYPDLDYGDNEEDEES